MGNTMMKLSSCLIVAFVSLMLLFPCIGVGEAASGGNVILEGDKVVYEQATDTAYAEGHVKMKYADIRVWAIKATYHVKLNKIEALGTKDAPIVLLQGAQRMEGQRLELDLASGEGSISEAYASYPAENGFAYAKGGKVSTIKTQSLKSSGWVKKSPSPSKIKSERVYKWENTSLTTCPEPVPHYSLKTKKLVVFPGYRAIVTKPRVFLKEHFLFTYPFDYIVPLTEKEEASPLMPTLAYDSDKGVGISIGTTYEAGEVSGRWKAYYWSKKDFEGALQANWAFNDNLKFFAEGDYSWDSDRDEKRFRPKWGAIYDDGNWYAKLLWSQAENVTVEKALGDTFKGVLWRKPEFEVRTPYYELEGIKSKLALYGRWGDYETSAYDGSNEVSIKRTAFGAALSGSTTIGDVRPYWYVSQWHYDYSGAGDSQDTTYVKGGLSWSVGKVNFSSTWVRRWVWGDSPMSWDDYSDSKSFYQKVSFPLSEAWTATVRGGYNLRTEDLEEMYYRLGYSNHCCYRFDVEYRDDLTNENDDWAGFVFVLDAFPSNPFFFNTRTIQEFDK